MGARRQAREAALQALFMCDFQENWKMEAIHFCFEHFSIPKAIAPYALTLCQGVIERIGEVDSLISCASEHWSLRRMARVDRTLLRLATYEMLALDDVPVNVSIDEAIEIAKRYGADNSPVFINGVLDKIASELLDPDAESVAASGGSRTIRLKKANAA